MRVFLSWSGHESHAIAAAMRDWLRYVFPTIDPYLSSEDTRKGVMWGSAIASQLSDADHGLVVLTPSNHSAPWILYEAGSLSKSLPASTLWTVLVGGLLPEHLQGSPLSLFQHTLLNEVDFLRLAKSINSKLKSGVRSEMELTGIAHDAWAKLKVRIHEAVDIGLREKRVLRISSLAEDTGIIAGRVFKGMTITGPAVLMPISGCEFLDCTFGTGGGSLDPILWMPFPEGRTLHIGSIGLYQCKFTECSFNGIGFAGSRERLAELKELIPFTGSDGGG